MALWERRDVSRARVVGGPVGHHDVEAARDLVLEMRRLAPFRPRYRLHVLGPAPARFQDEATDARTTNVQQLHLTPLEGAGLVRRIETLVLCTRHGPCSPSGTAGLIHRLIA